jgi:hypothetical protein
MNKITIKFMCMWSNCKMALWFTDTIVNLNVQEQTQEHKLKEKVAPMNPITSELQNVLDVPRAE